MTLIDDLEFQVSNWYCVPPKVCFASAVVPWVSNNTYNEIVRFTKRSIHCSNKGFQIKLSVNPTSERVCLLVVLIGSWITAFPLSSRNCLWLPLLKIFKGVWVIYLVKHEYVFWFGKYISIRTRMFHNISVFLAFVLFWQLVLHTLFSWLCGVARG